MCLTIRRFDYKVRRTTRDRVVYKKMYRDSVNIFAAPYRVYYYTLGKLHTERYFTVDKIRFLTRIPKGCFEVYAGFHCYRSLATARRKKTYSTAMVRCVIPKGTLYINGMDDEIVCLKLIPKEVVLE